MFSNVFETKCLENAVILAVYWHKELNKFAHPTTSGKKKTRPEQLPNECSAAIGLVSRSIRVPKRKQPMAVSDINYPSAAFGSAETRLPMTCAFVSHFRPYCVRWICVSFNALINFLRDWIYIMPRGYRDCLFRSEWLKDAKSKSLVGSD